MAISTTLTLPSQPATGVVTLIPLGGNGVISPISAYFLNVDVTGDASGGANTIRINRDPRYSQIVQHCSAELDGGGAGAREMRFRLRAEGSSIRTQSAVASAGGTLGDPTHVYEWNPPLQFMRGAFDDESITSSVENINLQAHRFRCRILNYLIQASELALYEAFNNSLIR